jgi:DNA polymerase I
LHERRRSGVNRRSGNFPDPIQEDDVILSIDGSYMLHRARYVAGKQGKPERDHIVLLFLRSLLTVAEKFSPTRIYIYFDRGKSKHRSKIHRKYKANRKKDKNDPTLKVYEEARDFLHQVLPKLGIISILLEGVEGDDFAHLIAANKSPSRGVHVSDDRDWFLNLYPGWYLFRPRADELISYEAFCDQVQNRDNPRAIYLMARAISGDKSDNIDGVKGFGWVTALEFASKLVCREDLGEGKKAAAIRDHMDVLRHNMNVMSPRWILNSEESKLVVREAEWRVVVISDSLSAWKLLCDKVSPNVKPELMHWWNRYNAIVRGLSNGSEY